MSVLFNIADKIIGGNTVPDYATFRKRVLADGGTITDDAQLKEDMEWVWRYKPTWFASPAVRKVDVLYGAPDLDGVVTRATTKTGINADGTIGTRVAGELPWSYKDSRISFLPESARTNLLQRSEEFDNAYWVKDNVTVTVNTAETLAPNGTQTATLVNEGEAVSVIHRLRTPELSFNQKNVHSVFVKYKSARYIRIVIGGTTSNPALNNRSADFDLLNGVVFRNTEYAPTAFIKPLLNGWYRIGFTMLEPSTTVLNRYEISILSTTGTTVEYTGTNREVYLWGAQLEAGSFASSYIPTTTASVTRNADVLTVTGASGVIGQTSGWIYAEVDWVRSIDIGRIIGLYNNTQNRLDLRNTSTNALSLVSVSNGSTIFSRTSGVFTRSGFGKLIVIYQTNNTKLYYNGSLILDIEIGTVPLFLTMDKISIGHLLDIDQFNDPIYRTAIGKGTLTEQQAIELTTI